MSARDLEPRFAGVAGAATGDAAQRGGWAWLQIFDCFHLGPGEARHIRLLYDGPADARARLLHLGEMRALNQGGHPGCYAT